MDKPHPTGPSFPVGNALPAGTVTFLFTDIVGSTPLWESKPDLMAGALEIHNAALQEARFEKLLAEGRSMSIDAAVKLGLDGTVETETPEIVEK